MFKRLIAIIAVVIAVAAAWNMTRPPQKIDVDVRLIAPDDELPDLGFRRVSAEYPWSFPDDDNPHPTFQRERWLLDLADCYEEAASVSFERTGLIAPALAPRRSSGWALREVISVSLQLPDREETRYSRRVLDLAGVEEESIWLDDLSLVWADDVYTLNMGDVLRGIWSVSGEPTTTMNENYYEIQYALDGELGDGNTCTAVLRHQFGASLPE